MDIEVEVYYCLFDIFDITDWRIAGYCSRKDVLVFVPVGYCFAVKDVATIEVKVDDEVDRIMIAGKLAA
ncbi:hypothetical protein TNCV_4129801 [Trichonephila clavipes]|nr:hypothetical protein TNCV_4129801 [Trichonephila clavipes]